LVDQQLNVWHWPFSKGPRLNQHLEREKHAGGNIPAGVSFPMRPSPDAGGAGISVRTLGTISFANFAEVLCELCGQKLLTAKRAEKGREGR
jgi:hypothetical protein